MKQLLELLTRARQKRYREDIPEPVLDDLSDNDRVLAEEVVGLLKQHRDVVARARRSRALMLGDADALGDAVSRVGMGDFDTPVRAVQTPGLDTVRIGIEDRTTRL